MKILVSGGAGYIGSTVAQQLLDAGHSVTIYDNLSSGHLAAIPAAATFVRGDTLDRAALDAVLAGAGFDAVLHFAAFIEAGESMREPGRFFRNNVTGSLTLIEAAVSHGVRQFVFSSTAGVYASKDGPLAEDDPVAPSSVYGATKYMVEQALEWYARIHGLRVAVLRYFNAAGAAGRRGRSTSARNTPDPAGAASGARPTGEHRSFRQRLSHARRHLHPRLHPHRRPGDRRMCWRWKGWPTGRLCATIWATATATLCLK